MKNNLLNIVAIFSISTLLLSCSGVDEKNPKAEGLRVSPFQAEVNVEAQKNFKLSFPAAAQIVSWQSSDLTRQDIIGQNLKYGKDLAALKFSKVFSTKNPLRSAPMMAMGNAYFLNGTYLTAYSFEQQKELWNINLSKISKEATVLGGGLGFENGKVYASFGSKEAVAVSGTSGVELWRHQTSSFQNSAPSLANGIVYLLSFDNKTYALNSYDGKQLWLHSEPSDSVGLINQPSPVSYGNLLFVPYQTGDVFVFNNRNGEEIINYSVNSLTESNNAISIKGFTNAPLFYKRNLVAMNDSGTIISVNLDSGEKNWEKRYEHSSFGWVLGNAIVTGSANGIIRMINAENGKLVWESNLKLTANEQSYRPIIVDGKILVLTDSGNVNILDPNNGSVVHRISTGIKQAMSLQLIHDKFIIASKDGMIFTSN